MALKSTNTSKDPSASAVTNRDKVIALMQYHKPLFVKEGVSNPKFVPRLCYPHNGVQVVTFFPKEIAGGQDIYIEFCNRELEPEDPDRTLWKWIFNPNYDEEYDITEPHPHTTDRRYIIPITELVNVKEYHEKMEATGPMSTVHIVGLKETPQEESVPQESIKQAPSSNGQSTDIPYEAMTVRDYAAIQWKLPVSNKDWLNELIIKTFK